MLQVTKLTEIKSVGTYLFNGCTIVVDEFTKSGKLKGNCTLQNGKNFPFTNGAYNLLKRIENDGITPKRENAGGTTLEKQFIKLQNALDTATKAMNDFKAKYNVTDAESAKRLDEKRKARKKAKAKETRDEKIKRLIKKAREYKQLERAMKLTDVLLG